MLKCCWYFLILISLQRWKRFFSAWNLKSFQNSQKLTKESTEPPHLQVLTKFQIWKKKRKIIKILKVKIIHHHGSRIHMYGFTWNFGYVSIWLISRDRLTYCDMASTMYLWVWFTMCGCLWPPPASSGLSGSDLLRSRLKRVVANTETMSVKYFATVYWEYRMFAGMPTFPFPGKYFLKISNIFSLLVLVISRDYCKKTVEKVIVVLKTEMKKPFESHVPQTNCLFFSKKIDGSNYWCKIGWQWNWSQKLSLSSNFRNLMFSFKIFVCISFT